VPKAPPNDDDSAAPEDAAKVSPGNPSGKGGPAAASRPTPHKAVPESRPPARVEDDEDDDDDEEDEDDDLDLDLDDEDDEELAVFSAREAAGAVATLYRFIRPLFGNYRKALAFVGFGLLVETLFNVIMPLSLKFLIDDALGEEDFGALIWILSALAVAGIVTSLISVWYERWDAWLSSSIISDVRQKLFDHVQELPSAFFARTKRGEILSRFSVDLAAFEGAMETMANTGLLPAMELVAGIILMLFLNWQQ
jgi:ATP-binding cassette subfamily B protein